MNESPESAATPRTGGRGTATALRRKERSDEILRATRRLFDMAGVRDAQIEDIAKAVGINRAIIYRHFAGKEELFALTLVTYLDELRDAMIAADDPATDATSRLRLVCEAFLEYGEEFPAFVDCAMTLLRTPGDELIQDLSEGALFKLGRSMGRCLTSLLDVLNAGVESGEFVIDNAPVLANVLYTQALGGLQLARLQLIITESAPGLPQMTQTSFDEVREVITRGAIAMAYGAGPR